MNNILDYILNGEELITLHRAVSDRDNVCWNRIKKQFSKDNCPGWGMGNKVRGNNTVADIVSAQLSTTLASTMNRFQNMK